MVAERLADQFATGLDWSEPGHALGRVFAIGRGNCIDKLLAS